MSTIEEVKKPSCCCNIVVTCERRVSRECTRARLFRTRWLIQAYDASSAVSHRSVRRGTGM